MSPIGCGFQDTFMQNVEMVAHTRYLFRISPPTLRTCQSTPFSHARDVTSSTLFSSLIPLFFLSFTFCFPSCIFVRSSCFSCPVDFVVVYVPLAFPPLGPLACQSDAALHSSPHRDEVPSTPAMADPALLPLPLPEQVIEPTMQMFAGRRGRTKPPSRS
ncbi:hypothetical protein O6H91_06G007300 [Diphasiastrum complanatum]|nr:hypothetical protein O6H91_06G007300 [Diphasiastrum complanatum]